MESLNLQKYKKIYFIGIGGISMSSLAEILHTKNYEVSGSDSVSNSLTNHLKEKGILVHLQQKYENIPQDIDLIVHTAAVKDDNPEIKAAKDKNIKIIDRATLLGSIMKSYKYPICISGTHGKTTTTSIMSEILLEANVNPTLMIGGILNSIGSNYKIGNNDYIALESCEYFNSFTKFHPYAAIVLNVDIDHLDFFKNLNEIETSFNKFCRNIDSNGFLVIKNDIKNLDKIVNDINCKIITYGNEEADYYADNIRINSNNHFIYDVINKGHNIATIRLCIPGEHNIQNSLATFIVGLHLGLEKKDILNGIYNFKGVNRRYEKKGVLNGVTIIDDYAHHPTEIIATLKTARNTKNINKIYTVFQPHTFSRTKNLLNEFSLSFNLADEVLILNIYPGRELDKGEIHSKDLVEKLQQNGINATYYNNFEVAKDYLLKNCINNDLLITMGAGDVYLIGEMMLQDK